VIHNQAQKYEVIYTKNEEPEKRALAYAKIMLAKIGLKLRAKKVRVGEITEYHYHVANIEEARTFISWREPDIDAPIAFVASPMEGIIEGRAEAYKLYGQLPPEQQAKVFALMDDFNSFDAAVNVIRTGGTVQW
jgi:hypothetical protein